MLRCLLWAIIAKLVVALQVHCHAISGILLSFGQIFSFEIAIPPSFLAKEVSSPFLKNWKLLFAYAQVDWEVLFLVIILKSADVQEFRNAWLATRSSSTWQLTCKRKFNPICTWFKLKVVFLSILSIFIYYKISIE